MRLQVKVIVAQYPLALLAIGKHFSYIVISHSRSRASIAIFSKSWFLPSSPMQIGVLLLEKISITMRSKFDLITSFLLCIALAQNTLAIPPESFSKTLESRANRIEFSNGCTNPSQLTLSSPPSPLGECNWKLWVLCTAVGAGACLTPCITIGGYVFSLCERLCHVTIHEVTLRLRRFADPACDACLAAMGAVGCLKCIEVDHDAHEVTQYVFDKVFSKRNLQTTFLRMEMCKPNATVSTLPSASASVGTS